MVGVEKTYDIEMKDEPHNFIANDFISHNSHSLSYGKFAVQMAYLKCYYRKYFNLSVMNNEEPNVKGLPKIMKTIEDCEQRGWMKKSNINELSYFFQLDNKGMIIPGVKILNGVGEKTIESAIKNKPYATMTDFIMNSKCNKTVMIALDDADYFINTYGKKLDRNIFEKKKKIKEEIKSVSLFD
jgi:DNA polymerase III alpha subunit